MKKGQVTIFIIVAIVIVGGVLAYFVLRGGFGESVPEEFRPVYDYYISCLESSGESGLKLLGEQGGRIDTGEFIPGSSYMPFSSHLDFFGQGIPYWMYVSGNNLLRENIPNRIDMEKELNDYVGARLKDCNFEEFERQGFDVYVDEGVVYSKINNLDVKFDVSNKISIFKGNKSIVVNSHSFKVSSKLGKFFELAHEVYDYEKKSMFLEKYALDVLRLYAPVDGVESGCAPKIFVDEKIRSDIVSGLAANIPNLKLDGDYYDLSSEGRKYFIEDMGIDVEENVNFMFLENWPNRIEIYGDRVVNPVGLQEGLGVLGFCYIPYHLVYDIDFPVLIQFYDDEELFQFPIGVVISKNQARKALPSSAGVSIESKVCEFKNQEVEVLSYDSDFNPVEAHIGFKCLNSVCDIGDTKIRLDKAVLKGKFPQCVNGFIIADAEGYAKTKYQISTNKETSASIVLNKKYKLTLDLGNVGKSLVSFVSDDYSTTILYPETKEIELVDGYYNISVHVYDNSSLKFPATSRSECVDVPEDGLAGMLGFEREKCYDINMPAMDIDFAVVGGGKNKEYITSEDLKHAVKLNLNVPLFGLPSNLDELMSNYERVDSEAVYLEFE